MKRLWLAAAILAATITLCVVTLNYQHKQIDTLLSTLDTLEDSARQNGTESATPEAERFLAEYEQRTRLFPCFMSHNDLIGCHETVATLPTLLATSHTEEFYQEISRCRAQLRQLRDVEAPSLRNIL